MDWDENQKKIRNLIKYMECELNSLVYEGDPDCRVTIQICITHKLMDLLILTENMTRHLKKEE